MNNPKNIDLFSGVAKQYAAHRPTYPDSLFEFLAQEIKGKDVWDCGTGSGQLAFGLAKRGFHVQATDISNKQIGAAPEHAQITYSTRNSYETGFHNQRFDAVTVAQAVHWFDFDLFYKEVKRVLKPGGKIFIIGYGLIRGSETFNQHLDKFYSQTLDGYWPEERKHIDSEYSDIPFIFEEIPFPKLNIEVNRTALEVIEYLKTWSAWQAFAEANGSEAIERLAQTLEKEIGPEPHLFTFPLFGRAGIIK